MPFFTISVAGGLFSATSSWVGGEVPTNRATADVNQDMIIGLSSSGPLTFNNLGNRNIPSLNLFDYANTLSFTGSNTLTFLGYTNSLSPQMTWQYQTSGSSTLIFSSVGLTATPMNWEFRGCSVSGNTYRFQRGAASPIVIKDEFLITGTSGLDIRQANASWYDVMSATIGVPAIIRYNPNTFDTLTFQNNVTRGSNHISRGNRVELWMNTGRVNFAQTPNIAAGVILVQNGSQVDNQNQMTINKWGGYRYISGTMSRSRSFIVQMGQGGETNARDIPSFVDFSNTPGFTFGMINFTHGRNWSTQYSEFTQSIYLGPSFSCLNFIFAGDQALNPPSWEIIGSGSNIFLGDTFINYAYVSRGPNDNAEYVENYVNLLHSFRPGPIYNMNRLVVKGAFLNEFGNEMYLGTTLNNRIITPRASFSSSGTSSVNLNLLRNESYCAGVSFSRVDITGYTLYAFGSTWSNSTGIEGQYPTGGGGGGETSYTYIS